MLALVKLGFAKGLQLLWTRNTPKALPLKIRPSGIVVEITNSIYSFLTQIEPSATIHCFNAVGS